MKICIFGDSFSDNSGCRPKDTYYEYEPRPNIPTWNNLLCKKLGVDYINRAKGGESNEYIQYVIQKYWNSINPGDLVIIGTTLPTRVPIIVEKDHLSQEKRIFSSSIANLHNEFIFSYFKKAWVNSDPNILKEVMLDFVHYFKTPFEKEWYQHHMEGYDFLIDRLKEKGVKVYLWEYDPIWGMFETIVESTNGEVDDPHWSWKGHYDMSEWIYKELLYKKLI